MSFGELVFLAILALLVFGPRKLPEVARAVARIMTELRRASNEFRYSLEDEIRNIEVQEADRKRLPVLNAAPAAVTGTVARDGARESDAVAPTGPEPDPLTPR